MNSLIFINRLEYFMLDIAMFRQVQLLSFISTKVLLELEEACLYTKC